jgi:DNA replication factor GINS
MNLEDLRRAKNRERETDSLQELPDDFYAEVATYIRERKAARADLADRLEDPFSSEEVTRLSDEIATAERIAESLYERRVGKVVKQASFAAADMGSGPGSTLTTEERDLYDDLVARIGENKHRVLDVIEGEPGADAETRAPSDEEATPAETDDGASRDVDAADLMGGEDGAVEDTDPQADGESTDDAEEDRTTVRITRDVGEIFGVDQRTYTLETDDVVTLPAENAAPLVQQDAAEPLE